MEKGIFPVPATDTQSFWELGFPEGAHAFKAKMERPLVEWLRENPGEKVIATHIGEPQEVPPRLALDELERIAHEGNKADHAYQDVEGNIGIRTAFAGYFARRNFLPVIPSPDNIIVTTSGKGAMNSALFAIVQPGEKVALFGPAYPGHIGAARKVSGGNLVRLPVREKDGWEPDPKELGKILQTEKPRVIVICDPQNPTGGVLINEVKTTFANYLAEDPRRILVADMIYSDFYFSGGKFSPISAIQNIANQVVVIHGASKCYAATGWRIGCSVWPNALWDFRQRAIGILNDWSACPATPLTNALIPSLLTVEGDKTIDTVVAQYKQKRDLLVRAINGNPILSCKEPQGAFYLMMNVSATGMSADQFAEFTARKAGVTVLPSACFGTRAVDIHGKSMFPAEEADKYVRISYVGDQEELLEGMRRISEALKNR